MKTIEYQGCEVCGEFECDVEHEEELDIDEDDSWFFDGSGMVNDD